MAGVGAAEIGGIDGCVRNAGLLRAQHRHGDDTRADGACPGIRRSATWGAATASAGSTSVCSSRSADGASTTGPSGVCRIPRRDGGSRSNTIYVSPFLFQMDW